MSTILKATNLVKNYGKKGANVYQALKGIDLQIEQGEFVAIMGASGSGKTTLLNLLSTLDRPTSGQIELAGHDLTSLPANQLAKFRGQEIGFIFQDFNLLENLTNRENIALPLNLQGVARKTSDQLLKKIVQRLGIDEILDKYPAEISGGQKQRVAAARALINQPAILFGDEPTGSLDSKSSTALLETMKDLNEHDDVSILMVTHDPYSASYASRILFIQDGLISQELTRQGTDRKQFYQAILEKLSRN